MKKAALLGLVAGCMLAGVLFGQAPVINRRDDTLDPSGANIPGAKVTLVNADTGVQRAVLSDAQGRYSFPQVQPGTYRVTAEAAGFTATTASDVHLLVSTPVTLDLTFSKVGSVQSTVSVVAEAEQVNTVDATLGNAVSSQAIPELPLEARNVAGLLAVQPGVVYLGEPVSPVPVTCASGSCSSSSDYRSGSVNGGKSDQANVTLDGIEVNDTFFGSAFTSVLRVTPDSVQEFRTVTQNGDAAMGRSSGAQTTLVTKSGTNAIHGVAYEYIRNTDTSANNFFNNETGVARPKLDRNVFGGAVGGPIKKNRIFYFGTYEGRRDASDSTALRTVPNAAFRQGNFSYVTTSGAVQTLGPAGIQALDPQGIGESAAVLADFNKYPLPNDTTVGDGLNTAGYRFNAPTPLRFNTYISKFDYQLDQNGKYHLFWRGNLQNDNYAGGIPQFPGDPASSVYLNNSKGYAIGFTAILRPTLVSTTHYGFTRAGVQNTGVLNNEYAYFQGITPLNATTLSSAIIAPNQMISDDLVWNKGAHTVSFGGSFRHTADNTYGPGTFSNAEVYANWYQNDGAGLLPANAKASQTAEQGVIDLLGIETNLSTHAYYNLQGQPQAPGSIVNRTWITNSGEMYLQDSWKILPNFTMTAGLRLSLSAPAHEANGYQVSPNIPYSTLFAERGALAAAGLPDTVPLVSYNLYGKPGTSGLYGFQVDPAPRFALAYSPRSTGRLAKLLFGEPGQSSIRAGWGMYYDNFGEALANRFSAVQLGLSTSLLDSSGQPATEFGRYEGFSTIPYSPLFPVPPAGGFPQVVPSVGENTTVINQNLKSPYDMNLNVTVAREFKGGYLLQLSFVDHQARRSLIGLDTMAPTNLVDTQSGQTYYQAAQILGAQALAGVPVGKVAPVPFFQDLWPGAATPTLTATQNVYKQFVGVDGDYTTALRNIDVQCVPSCSKFGPYAMWDPQYVVAMSQSSIGNGNYNGLQVTLRKRFSQGFQFDYNFTWSKCEDLGSQIEANGGSNIGNPWIASQNKAVCDYDLTRVSSALAVAQLPFGQGKKFLSNANRWVNGIAGGWQVSGLLTNTSGFNTSVADGVGYPTTWNSIKYATQTGLDPQQTTTMSAPPPSPGGKPGPDIFSNPALAFASYSPTLAGDIGQRNGIRGPGNFSIDLSLSKRFNTLKFHDQQQSFQIRAEVFNLTNSVRFDVRSASLDNNVPARFGQYLLPNTESAQGVPILGPL